MATQPLEDLSDLVARLIRNPRVIGIVRYGRRRADETERGGDFDLLVIVTERPHDVESIHFAVGDIPVDLSLRTVDDLRRTTPLSAMVDPLLPASELLFDRTGALRPEIAALPARWSREMSPATRLTEAEVARRRFGHRHTLDKARHRLTAEPLLCHVLLSTNIYWLLQTHLAARGLPYEGENAALTWLESHDPQVYQAIERFFATQDLAYCLQVKVLSHMSSTRISAARGGKGSVAAYTPYFHEPFAPTHGCRYAMRLMRLCNMAAVRLA